MATRKKVQMQHRRGRSPAAESASTNAKDFRRTIAVDFDGVIAEYDGWKGRGVLGPPRKDVVEALQELYTEGLWDPPPRDQPQLRLSHFGSEACCRCLLGRSRLLLFRRCQAGRPFYSAVSHVERKRIVF